MIKLYYGNTIDGCTNAVLSSIEGDRQAIVIAPDSYSFAIETSISRLVERSLDIEVMTFARFAMRLLGNKIKKCLSPEGCNMIMLRAVTECEKDLTYYNASSTKDGFANEIYSSLTAMRSSGITAERLMETAQSMTCFSKNKTKDLAILLSAYLRLMENKYTDPTTRLEALVREIPNNQFVKETDFYIVDFYAFNDKQYDVLSALMKYSHSFSIGVIDGSGLSNMSVFPLDTSKRIIELAKRAGTPLKRFDAYIALDEFASVINEKLFGIPDSGFSLGNVSLKLIQTQSPQDEADGVCREIAKLVRGGMRYKDIAVVAGDYEDPTLEGAFKDYNIPYFIDRKSPITDEPAVKLICDSVRAMAKRLDISEVMSIVKNPLSGISDQEGMLFENYCLRFGINYSRFTSPFELGKPEERELPELVRKKVMELIPDLPEQALTSHYVELIRKHLKEIDFDFNLQCFLDKELEYGEELPAKRTVQLPERIRGVLDMMDELLNDFDITLTSFSTLLFNSFNSVKLALIPLSSDCVHIGKARDCRFEGEKVFFFTSCAEGRIPQCTQDGTILSAKYHQDLQMYDIVIRPGVKEDNRYAKYSLIQLLNTPERIYISCPERASDGNTWNKSEIFTSLSSLFGVSIEQGFSHEPYEKAVTQKECSRMVSYALSQRDIDIDYYSGIYTILDDEYKDRISLSINPDNAELDCEGLFFTNGNTSVSQIETFYSCPYKFFLNYGLRAREREIQDIQASESGSFTHAVLEHFLNDYKDRLDELDDEKVIFLAEEICNHLLSNDDRLKGLIKGESERKIKNMIKNSCLVCAEVVRIIKKGDFRPIGTEVDFGFNNCAFEGVKLPLGTNIVGKVDRIDECEDRVIVIDYKTGKVEPELKSIYYGKKLQLYVYLYALRQAGLKPSGAFYQKVESRYAKTEESERFRYAGYFLDDSYFFTLMDKSLFEEDKSGVLELDLSAKNKSKYALTEEDFSKLIDYSYRMAVRAEQLIKGGYTKATPLEHACDYCPIRATCANDKPQRKLLVKKVGDF